MRSSLLEPLTFANGLTLRNRVVMAPMTTWSGQADGQVSQGELAFYRRRAAGPGLMITGCTHVQANGVGFTDEFACYDDTFLPGLTALAAAARSDGAKAVLQIFHAGNKTLASISPGGEVVSASAVMVEASPFAPAQTPRALSANEITDVIAAFGAAARRAVKAGFDGVELHGAHGFLIQNFLSPRYNQRQDAWGGSPDARMAFSLAVVEAVKTAAAEADRPFLVGYRLSPEEPETGGLRIDDTLALTDRLIEAGVDYIHLSLMSVLEAKPLEGGDRTIVDRFVERVAGRAPILAAGQVRTRDQAQAALERGLAFVALGQGLVMDPDWVAHAQDGAADDMRLTLDLTQAEALAIPAKLAGVIQAAPGWFPLIEPARQTASAVV